MFSTFTSFVILYLYLQSTFSKELATDKESLKNSLVQVDHFLKNVGQRIQNERNFLHTAGRRRFSSPTGGSNEDYSALWFGGKASNIPNNSNKNNYPVLRGQSEKFSNYSNFVKAFATFNENYGKESTKKLINAVADLKDLVEHNNVDIKNELPDSPNEAEKKDILRQIQETLKKREKIKRQEVKKPKLRKSDDATDGGEDDLDIFKGMDFPKKSDFPFSVGLKTTTTTTTGTLPEVLSPGFITPKGSGPGADILTTPSTTTDSDEALLDPKEFGYTTTHRTLQTFGDIGGSPQIDPVYLTTKSPDDPFVASLKQDMAKFSMGVFSISALKIFHMVIWKKADVVKALVWGFRRVIENMITFNKFRDFGEVTQKALTDITTAANRMQYDQLKTDAIMLHHALLHRREMFSPDINYLLDEMDSLYTKKEADELLRSLEPLDVFNDPKKTPFKPIEKVILNILAPIKRLDGAPRREGLIVALSRALKTHFYATHNIPGRPERRNAPKIPLDFLPKPTVDKNDNYAVWEKIQSWNPIKINQYSTLSENTMNLTKTITTDLQYIYNNLINTKQSNTNKAIDDTKPQAIFRTGDHYVNEKVIPPASNDTVLNDDFNMFDMEMYKDYKDNMVSEPPVTDIVNYKVNDNRMINNDRMIEANKKKPDDVLNMQKFDQGNYPIPMVSPVSQASLAQSPTMDLIMAESKRHHKRRHHRKHRHHMSLRQKLAKIKRIMKLYRSETHHRRFRHKHHHKHNKHKAPKNLNIRQGTYQPITTNKINKNATKVKPINDRRFQFKKTPITTSKLLNSKPPSVVEYYQHTTQVYEVKDKFNKKNFRRQFDDELKKLIDLSFVRRANEASDEEIPLKTNLYKAMALGTRSENQLFPRARAAKRNVLLRESSGSDDEALLKNKIYNYFNNIQAK